MRSLSVVIPTYNMADYLPLLWDGLVRCGCVDAATEILFVNDGSTDLTQETLEHIKQELPEKVTIVSLVSNQGQFLARLKGAETARGTHLLFLDTRLDPTPNFGESLVTTLARHDVAMGKIRLDGTKSVFNLYWKRTHEFWFWRTFRDMEKGFYITPENYGQYVKGTTIFLCRKDLFIESCRQFEDQNVHSDDTFLMFEIAKRSPIWVEKTLEAVWEPRQQWDSFLARLWERGPKFAEYHVLEKQGLYFFLFMVWTLASLLTLLALMVKPWLGLTLILVGLGLLALSTALFARGPVEFFRLAPLHVASICSYAFGAMWGVLVVKGWVPKPKPTGAVRN